MRCKRVGWVEEQHEHDLLRLQACTTYTETGFLVEVPNDEKIYRLEEINREAGGRQTSRKYDGNIQTARVFLLLTS